MRGFVLRDLVGSTSPNSPYPERGKQIEHIFADAPNKSYRRQGKFIFEKNHKALAHTYTVACSCNYILMNMCMYSGTVYGGVAFTRSNALSGCDLIMRWAGQPSPANIPAHSNATSDKINVKDNSCFIEMRKTRTTPHTE